VAVSSGSNSRGKWGARRLAIKRFYREAKSSSGRIEGWPSAAKTCSPPRHQIEPGPTQHQLTNQLIVSIIKT
jgi:hypothetical protein